MLTFSKVTGTIDVAFGGAALPEGHGSDSGPSGFIISPVNGISGFEAQRYACLVGVFLSDIEPVNPAPPAINFAAISLAFTNLEPGIGQVFYIGDGLTALGQVQRFIVPTNATRLFLGIPDHCGGTLPAGWYDDNVGAVTAEFLISRIRTVPIQTVLNRQPALVGGCSYALVAGKDLVVRVFGDTGVDGPTADVDASLCVDGDAGSCASDELFRSSGKFYPLGHSFTLGQRRRAEDSLNFFITGDTANRLLTAGTHTFSVRVSPRSAGVLPEMTDTLTCLFRESVQINIFVLPVGLDDGKGNLIGPEDSPAPGPDTADGVLLEQAGDFLRRVYPVDEEHVQVTVLPRYDLDGRSELDCNDLSRFQKHFLCQILRNDKAVTNLYGQTSPQNNFVLAVANNVVGANNAPAGKDEGVSLLGFTLRNQPSPKTVITLDRIPSGDPTLLRPNAVIIGSTVAHEIGHTQGFGDDYANPSSGGGVNAAHGEKMDAQGTSAGYYILEEEMAFDVSGLRPVLKKRDDDLPVTSDAGAGVFITVDASKNPPQPEPEPIALGAVYGYMSGTGRSAVPAGIGAALEGGGDVRAWTRQSAYEYLYPRLTKELQRRKQAFDLVAAPPRQVILISGRVSQAGKAAFDPFIVSTTTFSFESPQPGPYAIEFRDQANNVVGTVPFTLSFLQHLGFDGDRALDSSAFNFVLDLPPNTHSVRLLKEGAPLASATSSAAPPAVRILSVQQTNAAVRLRWSGSDPDGDSLRYSVLYSPNGADRYLLVTDADLTQLTVSLASLPAPESNARVILQAEDGFHSAEDSAPLLPQLSVQRLGQQVIISWPEVFDRFVLECSTNLLPDSWISVTKPAVASGGIDRVTIEVNERVKFFRLRSL
ncbi:MAG: hypothetical protein HY299_04155 [Verrucomicrobia bacterium]|nr:hypothetical protein [Verrucomicrobiota bacterium]